MLTSAWRTARHGLPGIFVLATWPVLALEGSVIDQNNIAEHAAAESTRSTNDTTLGRVAASLKLVKSQVDDLMACNRNQQVWTGSGCRSVDIVSYTRESDALSAVTAPYCLATILKHQIFQHFSRSRLFSFVPVRGKPC